MNSGSSNVLLLLMLLNDACVLWHGAGRSVVLYNGARLMNAVQIGSIEHHPAAAGLSMTTRHGCNAVAITTLLRIRGTLSLCMYRQEAKNIS